MQRWVIQEHPSPVVADERRILDVLHQHGVPRHFRLAGDDPFAQEQQQAQAEGGQKQERIDHPGAPPLRGEEYHQRDRGSQRQPARLEPPPSPPEPARNGVRRAGGIGRAGFRPRLHRRGETDQRIPSHHQEPRVDVRLGPALKDDPPGHQVVNREHEETAGQHPQHPRHPGRLPLQPDDQHQHDQVQDRVQGDPKPQLQIGEQRLQDRLHQQKPQDHPPRGGVDDHIHQKAQAAEARRGDWREKENGGQRKAVGQDVHRAREDVLDNLPIRGDELFQSVGQRPKGEREREEEPRAPGGARFLPDPREGENGGRKAGQPLQERELDLERIGDVIKGCKEPGVQPKPGEDRRSETYGG